MFSLYVIVDRGVFATAGEWLAALAEVARVTMNRPGVGFQVRVKGLAAEKRAALTAGARQALREHAQRAILNGSVDEALAAGFGGTHWPEADIPDAAPRVPAGFVLGASVHSLEALRRAESAGAHFALFGPVFDAGSKPARGVGREALREVAKAARIPVLAVGGITPGRAASCIEAGAAGVAAVTGVLHAPDAGRAITHYVDACHRAGDTTRQQPRPSLPIH